MLRNASPHSRSGRSIALRAASLIYLLCHLIAFPALSRAAEILCGDTDLDGLFETEDIQACINALDGPGPHVVRLVAATIFEPHFTDTASFYNAIGFVELESGITLDCQGSTIRGIDHVAKQAPSGWDFALWVVTNSDHLNDSQSNIWVRNCVIDGGMPAKYNEDSEPFEHDAYMGFALYGVDSGGISASQVRDTHHACVYIRNSQDIFVEDNQFDACGGANNDGSAEQPAVYLFQAGQTVQERITVRRNSAVRAGRALFNTRTSEANAEYQTAWMRDVTFEDNYGDQQGNSKPCISLAGTRGVVARGNTCVNTAGIYTTSLNSSYCADNPAVPINPGAEASCLENVLIEGNLFQNTQSVAGNGALTIHDYHDSITVLNNRVIVTERLGTANVPCMRWETPLRNFAVDGLCGTECDAWGIDQLPSSLDQVGAPPDEAITLRNIVLLGTRLEGLLLRKRLEGLVVDRLAVRDSGGLPMLALGELVGETITNLDLDEGPLPTWAAGVCASAVPALFPGAGPITVLIIVVAGMIVSRRVATSGSRAGQQAPCTRG